jgi:hypothetical protein
MLAKDQQDTRCRTLHQSKLDDATSANDDEANRIFKQTIPSLADTLCGPRAPDSQNGVFAPPEPVNLRPLQ